MDEINPTDAFEAFINNHWDVFQTALVPRLNNKAKKQMCSFSKFYQSLFQEELNEKKKIYFLKQVQLSNYENVQKILKQDPRLIFTPIDYQQYQTCDLIREEATFIETLHKHDHYAQGIYLRTSHNVIYYNKKENLITPFNLNTTQLEYFDVMLKPFSIKGIPKTLIKSELEFIKKLTGHEHCDVLDTKITPLALALWAYNMPMLNLFYHAIKNDAILCMQYDQQFQAQKEHFNIAKLQLAYKVFLIYTRIYSNQPTDVTKAQFIAAWQQLARTQYQMLVKNGAAHLLRQYCDSLSSWNIHATFDHAVLPYTSMVYSTEKCQFYLHTELSATLDDDLMWDQEGPLFRGLLVDCVRVPICTRFLNPSRAENVRVSDCAEYDSEVFMRLYSVRQRQFEERKAQCEQNVNELNKSHCQLR